MGRVGDLRQWIRQVEELGELRHINGIDWDQEIACVSDRRRGEPCVRPGPLGEHEAGPYNWEHYTWVDPNPTNRSYAYQWPRPGR